MLRRQGGEGILKISVRAWTIAVVTVVVITMGAIIFYQQAPRRTKVELTIIGGETRSLDQGGFAFAGEEVVSPGPTIRVKRGQQVTISFRNVHGTYTRENISHNFVVVAEIKYFPEISEPLWGAKTDYVEAGGSTSVTFTPDTVGEFFYVCDVPGHPERGMFGSFIVED